MFSRRLQGAFVLLAALAVALGGLAWWMAREAGHRVERGRVAADLQAGLLDLSADKLRLQAWTLRALLGARPDPGEADGEAMATAMALQVAALRGLAERASAMDAARGKPVEGHAARLAALAALDAALRALRAELALLPREPRPATPELAWARLDALFAAADAPGLRGTLGAGVLAEAAALAEERAAADASLARMRRLAGLGSAALVLLALGLALGFTVALRRPMRRLGEGAAALSQGALDHRIEGLAPDEFGDLAARMNRMAAELARSREAERELRAGLEREVAVRTRDLSRAVAELGEAEAARRQLLADIGHELRTPATVIRGEAEVALRARTEAAAEQRAALGRIHATALELGTLIEDVLVLASAEAAALPVELAEVPAAPTVLAAVQAGRLAAQERGVALHHRPAAEAALLLADPLRLRQVAGALVDNAVRYSHPGGEVRVTETLDHQAGRWRLEVLDRGIGVAAEEVPRLFDRGYRATAARAHRADGTGLGLAIARALAERLGGEVTLAPRPGGGAQAALSLPLLATEAAG